MAFFKVYLVTIVKALVTGLALCARTYSFHFFVFHIMVGKIIAILLILAFTSHSIVAQILFPTNNDENETEKVNQSQEDIVNSLFRDSDANEIFTEDFGQPVVSRYFKMFRNVH